MTEKTGIITFRIDADMKTAFEQIADELDLTTSQMLRRYIKRAVEQHAAENAQAATEEPKRSEPIPGHQPMAKKPAKGQRMASVKPANWRRS